MARTDELDGREAVRVRLPADLGRGRNRGEAEESKKGRRDEPESTHREVPCEQPPNEPDAARAVGDLLYSFGADSRLDRAGSPTSDWTATWLKNRQQPAGARDKGDRLWRR